MPGLEPGIHVFASTNKAVDGRVKPGHDERVEARSKPNIKEITSISYR